MLCKTKLRGARESYFDDGVEEYGNGGRVKGEQGWGWDEGGTDGGGWRSGYVVIIISVGLMIWKTGRKRKRCRSRE